MLLPNTLNRTQWDKKKAKKFTIYCSQLVGFSFFLIKILITEISKILAVENKGGDPKMKHIV